ncbi:5-aminolevulinate synthase [Streptomyces triculaminicus]|uniref:5-aminolevulinic acid synthase n=1 Tax=Streptomyces triculaminicus TaxID=2816232 RepID=A0A939FP84_9ACTN|nr:5-aminolevulinate synthase [Streptomyces triculaminicus]MBO0654276.1 5-aminolevulinate synthase [Streptomyces triculaminicus]
MFDYSGFFADRMDSLRKTGQYRTFVEIERLAGRFPRALHHRPSGPREVTVWCSNDHLGMGQHPAVLAAMRATLDASGAAAGGSRNISGTTPHHVALEREMADLHGKERALSFITGYAANDAALYVLGRTLPDCAFFSDRLNHASMILAMRASGAERHVFAHNDPADLDRRLSTVRRGRPKVVAFESVYSMDGDMAPMADLCAVAERHDALVYVDEAHTVGMYGPQGAGLAAQLGVADGVTVLMGTFAKGFGTAGGYLAGPDPVIDAVRSLAPAFIFTLSMPPALAAGALASVRHLRAGDTERELLHERAGLLKSLLRRSGIPLVSDESHIVPVLVGDVDKCRRLAGILLDRHALYAQPINFPSVARGSERLRINPSPVHRPEDVHHFADVLDRTWDELGLPRTPAPAYAEPA